MTESTKTMEDVQAEKARSLLKRFFVTDLLSPGMSLGKYLVLQYLRNAHSVKHCRILYGDAFPPDLERSRGFDQFPGSYHVIVCVDGTKMLVVS